MTLRRIHLDELIMPGDFVLNESEDPTEVGNNAIGFTGQQAAVQWPNKCFFSKRETKHRILSEKEIIAAGHLCCLIKNRLPDKLKISRITDGHWGKTVEEMKKDHPHYHFISVEKMEKIFSEPFGLIKEIIHEYCLPK